MPEKANRQDEKNSGQEAPCGVLNSSLDSHSSARARIWRVKVEIKGLGAAVVAERDISFSACRHSTLP